MNLKSFKMRAPLKKIVNSIAPYGSQRYQILRRLIVFLKSLEPINRRYKKWIRRCDLPKEAQAEEIRKQIEQFSEHPLISIIMPVYDPPKQYFHEAIQSVIAQEYPYWELCIADDASSDPEIKTIIENYAKEDSRIKYVFRQQNGHISAASNSALDLARGDYIALLDHDDTLHPFALYAAARVINENPNGEIIFSDEDKLTGSGKRLDPYFKPDFDHELLLNHNYLIHLGIYKHSSVRRVGGFRLGYEGSQDYDLILRLIDQATNEQIIHIPHILYHWRMSIKSAAENVHVKPYAVEAAMLALTKHFERNGIQGSVEFVPELAVYHPRFKIPEPKPAVDILFISSHNPQKTIQRIQSLLPNTKYKNFHLTILYDKSTETKHLSAYQDLIDSSFTSMTPYDTDENLGTVINKCVTLSQADDVCIIGECINEFKQGWLSRMIEQASQDKVGAVGPKLITQHGKVYSSGMILGQNGLASNLFQNQPKDSPGYLYWGMLQRGYSALSGECMLISKYAFNDVNGFEPRLRSQQLRYLDLFLKLRAKGYRNILVPSANLVVDEKIAEDNMNEDVLSDWFDQERNYIYNRWQKWIENDPAFNPNLSLKNGDVTINLSPRKTIWND